MLETLAANILTRYLGEYVSGLQKENIKLAIGAGNAVLENLELKKDALDRLDLPIIVKKGFLGKLTLTIPWKSLQSTPATITIDRLFLIASPKPPSEINVENIERKEQQDKLRKLAEAEMLKQAKADTATDSSLEKGDTFASRLVTKIIDNVQVEITDVHVRYEDDITDPKHPFVVGITLERLGAQSTDGNWIPRWIESVNIIHKLVELKKFSVYWNANSPFLQFSSNEEMGSLMKNIMNRNDNHYLLSPVSGSLKTVINKSELPDMKIPKLQMDFEFSEIDISLEEKQYQNIIQLMERISLYQKGIPYRKIRPAAKVQKDPKAWWKFAINATLNDLRAKKHTWTWEYISSRRKKKQEYIPLYRKIKVNIKLTPEEQQRIEKLEAELSLDDILFFRSLAEALAKKDKAALDEKAKNTQATKGWLSSWWSSPVQETLPDIKMTEDEWKEIYATVGYDDTKLQIVTNEPKDYVRNKFGFILPKGILQLKLDAQRTLAKATFSSLGLTLSVRPDSSTFSAHLRSIDVVDMFTPNTKFFELIAPANKGDSEDFFSMILDSNPLDKPGIDYNVSLEMRPLQVVYNMALLDRIVSFFMNVSQMVLEDIEFAAASRLQALREQTTQQLALAIASHKTVSLRVSIKAPTIVIPLNCTEQSTELLVVDLGTLYVESNPKPKTDSKDVTIKELAEEDFYDEYKLNLTELNALVATNSDNWRDPQVQVMKSMHLVEQFNINFIMKVSKLQTDTLTRVIVRGELPSLRFSLSSEKGRNLMKIIRMITGADKVVSTQASSQTGLPTSTPQKRQASAALAVDDLTESSNIHADKSLLVKSKYLDLEFVVPEVIVTIVQDFPQRRDLVLLQAIGLKFTFLKRSFDMQVRAVLQSLVVEDKLQPYGPEFLYLANSTQSQLGSSNTDLVVIEYVNIQRDAPHYAGVDQSVQLRFSSLYIMWNPETIIPLYNMINYVFGSSSKKPQNLPSSTSNPNLNANITKPSPMKKKPNLEILNLQVTANMEALVLTLNKSGTKFALITLANSYAAVNFQVDDTFEIQGQLGNITMKDLTPEGKRHNTVFQIHGDRMVDFSLKTFPIRNDSLGCDMILKMTINTIHFVYLNRFAIQLGDYFRSMQAMEAIATAAAEKAIEAVGSYVETRKLLRYEILITNPVLILPRNSYSEEALLVDLGQITICNGFEKLDTPTDTSESILLGISKLNLASAKCEGSNTISSPRQIVSHIDVEVKIGRPLSPTVEVPYLTVSVIISKIGILVNEQQIKLLLGVYGENWIEYVPSKSLSSSTSQQNDDNSQPKEGLRLWEPSDPKAVQLQLNLDLSQISLELRSASTLHDDSPSPLYGFYANQLSAQMKMFFNSAMQLTAGLSSIVVVDNRLHTTNQFRNIIAPSVTTSLPQEHQLILRYVKKIDGNQDVNIVLHRATIIAVPDAIYQLVDYVLPLVNITLQTFEKVANAAKTPSPNKTETEVKEANTFTLNLNLQDPMICFVEYVDNPDSRSLVLKSSITIKQITISDGKGRSQQRSQFLLQDVTLFKCLLLHEADTAISIVDPFTVSVNYSNNDKEEDITASVEPIRLLLSYFDFKLFMKIWDSFFGKNKSTGNPNSNVEDATHIMRAELRRSFQKNMEKRKSITVSTPAFKRESFKLTGGVFRIIVINDIESLNTPVVDVLLNECMVDVMDWSKEMSLLVVSKVKANYFNPQIQRWESLIEPWSFHIKVKGKNTSFISSERVGINLTTGVLDTFLRAWGTWTDDYYNKSNRKAVTTSLAAHPYYLCNSTGQTVFYWVDNEDPKELLFGKEVPLNLIAEQNRKLDMGEFKKHVISFQVVGEFKPVTNFPVDRMGSFPLPMNPEDPGMKILVNINYRAGSKVITLKSSVEVYNDTTATMEVLLKVDSLSQMYTLEPRSTLPIPIVFSSKGTISVRPAATGSTPFSYSGSIHCSKLQPATDLLICKSSNNDLPFLYMVQVKQGQSPAQTIINFRPPVIVENLLASKMDYFIRDSNTKMLLLQGSLDSGREVAIHQMRVNQILAMSIQVQGFGFKPSQLIGLNGSGQPSSVLLYDDQNRPLKVKIDNNVTTEGTRRVSFYVKYFLINHTGLRLLYSYGETNDLVAGQTKYETSDNELWRNLSGDPRTWYKPAWSNVEPLMFSRRTNDKTCCVKIANSQWSKPLTFSTQGVQGFLELLDSRQQNSPMRSYQLAGDIEASPNPKFWRTKVVTFSPRYILVNKMKTTLYLRQQKTDLVVSLRPEEQIPFHWPNALATFLLQMRLEGDYNWSGAFNIESPDNFNVRILNMKDSIFYYARVQVKVENASNLVIFMPENTSLIPYRVVNKTLQKIVVNQKGVFTGEIIPPGGYIRYAWDEPCGSHVLQVRVNNQLWKEFKLDKIKKYPTENDTHYRAEVTADGPTRVLTISRVVDVGNDLTTKEEVRVEDLHVMVDLEGVGISVINETPLELAFLSLDKLLVEYISSNINTSLELQVKTIQIDNQLLSTPLPVILAPVANEHTFFHLSLLKSNKHEKIMYFNYFSLLVQEANIALDEEFIVLFLKFINSAQKLLVVEQAPTSPIARANIYVKAAEESPMIYFELFHLNPVKANISFVSISGLDTKYNNSVSKMLGVSEKILGNIDNAPLILNGLILKNAFSTQDAIIDSIAKHYQNQFVRQVYKILGSFDFIGSPLALVNNLGSGVYDFFHEPAKGIIQSPQDFGVGLAKGTTSLVKNSIKGIFNSASKITGSIGSNIATLSMDSEYLKERQERDLREKPKHVGDGLLLGVRDFTFGLFKGVTGIVEEPIKGAASEGMEGFIKGLGRGLIGAAVKPTVGAIDLATQTTKGIRNTATMWETSVERRRPPRVFDQDKTIEPYSILQAEGSEIVRKMSKGKHKNEQYFYHAYLGQPDRIVIVTNKHIFLRNRLDLHKVWTEFLINVKPDIDIEDHRLVLHLFSEDPPYRTIYCQDDRILQAVYKHLANILMEVHKHT